MMEYERGDLVQLNYFTREWHTRLLLKPTTPEVMKRIIGEEPRSDSVWWVLTPSGDIFPEEVADGPDLVVRCVEASGEVRSRRLPARLGPAAP